MNLRIEAADPLGADALALLAEAAAEARQRYPEFFGPAAPPPTNAPLQPRAAFFLARGDAVAVGCGALRPLDATTAELTRMFVQRSARRRGLARALVTALLAQARDLDYAAVRLETGNRQPEAMALYASCGFARIAPFGAHVGDPTSVCFELRLAPASRPCAGR
ncbi:MAG: GNAT family N-acetyltransferase [Betaproteobacteria bacterium]